MLSYFKRYTWDLAIVSNTQPSGLPERPSYNVIKHSRDRWFADPFILDVTPTEIVILAEEYRYQHPCGRIAKVIIDRRNNSIKRHSAILELDTHLSFPIIIREKGNIYICPENSASGAFSLYEYNPKTDEVLFSKVLVNEPLTDAVPVRLPSGNYIFSTKLPRQNGNILDVYKYDEVKYRHIQELILKDNSARGAGLCLSIDDSLIRVAQDCNNSYGKGLVFQEVIDEGGIFRIEEKFRLYPPRPYIGMHTYNYYNGIAIVDLHRPLYPICLSFFSKVRNVFRKMRIHY